MQADSQLDTKTDGFDLTREDIETYRVDGVVCLRNVLDHGWIERLRDACDRMMETPSAFGGNFNKDSGTGRFFGDLWMWRQDADFRALAFDSPLPDIAAGLMGSRKVNLVWDQLLVKEPDTPLESPWHQDQPYAWADGRQNVSFWVPLDPVTLENGAVEFVRGSHDGPWFQAKSFHPDRKYESDDYHPLPDINADRTAYDIAYWETEPGDVIAHHLAVLHYARGNHTTARRRATAVRYAGDDAVYAVRKNGPPVLFDPGLAPGDPLDSDLFPVVRDGV